MRVLLAEDDDALRLVLHRALRNGGLDVIEAADGRLAAERIDEGGLDVAVLDVRLPHRSGLDLLRLARSRRAPLPVVVITAQDTMENAILAMKGGAYEYLCKPFDLKEFVETVRRAATEQQSNVERTTLPDGAPEAPETRTLFGRSPAMQQVFKAIGRAAPSPHPVLVHGESGTGKELVARILHRESPRASGPFVAVNTAALPATLMEAELFGHQRGAFTGADRPRDGRFVAADGGTLFLDEIGEMPAAVQAKLLRVLQERSVHPVGSDREVRVDVRVIAATHRDLAEEVRAGRFRADLYYRLHVLAIRLPPLRERTEDLAELSHALLDKLHRERSIERRSLAPDALRWIRSWHWPGNVRELENTLVRAATFSRGPVLHEADLRAGLGASIDASAADLDAQLRPILRVLLDQGGAEGAVVPRVTEVVERVLIALALERTGGHQGRAAALLGVHRNTLRRRLQEMGHQGSAPEEEP